MCMYAMCCISLIHKNHDYNLLNFHLGVNCHRCVSLTEEQEYERLVRWYLPYYSTLPRERWDICWCSIEIAYLRCKVLARHIPTSILCCSTGRGHRWMNRGWCADLQEKRRDIECSSQETNCDCLFCYQIYCLSDEAEEGV